MTVQDHTRHGYGPDGYAPAPQARSVARLRPSYGLFVDGRFVSGGGGQMDSINPADETVLATVEVASADDVDRAVRAARRAYDEV